MVDRGVSVVVEGPTLVVCRSCGEAKPPEDYRPSDLLPTGRGMCRPCSNRYEKGWRDGRLAEVKQAQRKVRTVRQVTRDRALKASDPKRYGDRFRQWYYSLTVQRFDQMVVEQAGRCANPRCDQPLDHIDHDHSCCPEQGRSCGKCVRGLLCRECNLTLGNAGDDINRLKGLVEYLKGGQ